MTSLRSNPEKNAEPGLPSSHSDIEHIHSPRLLYICKLVTLDIEVRRKKIHEPIDLEKEKKKRRLKELAGSEQRR